mmetsp:Transcript_7451/g.22923  ORF Transcript_7451/g.22923 Transcript_7451/m.22923 type:complete len:222 (+) Transcript_7451:967-1632(+)
MHREGREMSEQLTSPLLVGRSAFVGLGFGGFIQGSLRYEHTLFIGVLTIIVIPREYSVIEKLSAGNLSKCLGFPLTSRWFPCIPFIVKREYSTRGLVHLERADQIGSKVEACLLRWEWTVIVALPEVDEASTDDIPGATLSGSSLVPCLEGEKRHLLREVVLEEGELSGAEPLRERVRHGDGQWFVEAGGQKHTLAFGQRRGSELQPVLGAQWTVILHSFA